jgi:arylsulfatase A-like enzyme
MPHGTGVDENGRDIAAGIPIMGEIFRHAKYHTVYGGKWHVPKPFEGPPHFELIGGQSLGQRMGAPLAEACVKFLQSSRNSRS